MITAGKMHAILPPGARPLAKLEHFKVSRDEAALHKMRSLFSGRPTMGVEPGKYVRLCTRDLPSDGWTLMMSDTPFEVRSALGFIGEATGDVLILGLGLGATTVPVLAKPEVTSVTVIEKNMDVIDLVMGPLRRQPGGEKLTVVHDNAFAWKPARGQKFDTMWFDIWPTICEDNLPEMSALRRRLTRSRKPGAGPVMCWEESFLRARRDRERRTERYIYGAVGGRLR